MALLLVTALMFTVRGGQITVMVTDFVQGVFCNILYLLIVAFILLTVDWSTLMEGISYAAPEASRVHPFHTSATRDYDQWFFLISIFYILVLFPADGANQAPNSSARSAHEARMGWVLSNVRGVVVGLAFLLLPILAYTVMHHPDYAPVAESVNQALEGQDSQVQREVLVPVVMAHFLPAGLVGGFAALMLAAFIACSDSYLHVFGSIVIQDMVLPFRKKPFSPETHLLLLRTAVVGVALVAFLLGLLYKPRQDIQMFWALLMTFSAGAAVIPMIGGLYWKWGTTFGAWASAATGALLSAVGFWVRRYHPEFPMNAQVMSFFIVLLCIGNFAVVSLVDHFLRRREPFDMDRMLHRGRYAVQPDNEEEKPAGSLLFRALGVGKEFTKADIAISFGVVAWTGFWFVLFIVGTVYSLLFDLSTEAWEQYWRYYIWAQFGVGSAVVVLFAVGGLANFRDLVKELRSEERNERDNGMVVGHANLEDVAVADADSE